MGQPALLPTAVPSEPLLQEYVHLFNERYFYDCHEVAEDLWIEVADDPDPGRPDRDFLRGLIHVATAFHHLFRRNRRGFEARARSALGLLGSHPPLAHGLPVGALCDSLRLWLGRLPADAAAPAPAYRDADVPRI
jgi:predicted metal-dependent hydrolase